MPGASAWVLDMSPGLDRGELRAIRQRADELGMYVETGLGKVNPYASPEAPELWQVGDGDIVLGFRRMMEACPQQRSKGSRPRPAAPWVSRVLRHRRARLAGARLLHHAAVLVQHRLGVAAGCFAGLEDQVFGGAECRGVEPG